MAHELRTKAMTVLVLFLSIIAVTPASALGCFIFSGQILGRGQIGIPQTLALNSAVAVVQQSRPASRGRGTPRTSPAY